MRKKRVRHKTALESDTTLRHDNEGGGEKTQTESESPIQGKLV